MRPLSPRIQGLTLASDFRQELVEKKTGQVQRLTNALAQAKYTPHTLIR